MTDPIFAAIAHIRRITPSNDPWTAKDIAFEPGDPDEVDDSIATILNAVVSGQLMLAPPASGGSGPADPIAAARALIEPLTGYTPKPWKQGQNNPDRVSKGGEYIANCNPTHQSHPRTENNARLMAASPDLRDMVATLADALEAERAKVAAAYEAAEELCKRRSQDYAQMVANAGRSGPSHPEYVCDSTFHHWSGKSSAYSEMATDIRNLTPSDAQAALDKMLAEARMEGWRAGREAAAAEAALYGCSEGADEYTEGIHVGYTDAVGQIVDGIRALPEPKEASHG